MLQNSDDVAGSGSTTTVALPTELFTRLLQRARRSGLSIDCLLERLLDHHRLSSFSFLPSELIVYIFLFLPARVIASRVAGVCRMFRSMTSSCNSLRRLLDCSGVYDRDLRLLDHQLKPVASMTSGQEELAVDVSFACFCVYDRRIYRFGGRLPTGERLNTCAVYDPMARVPTNWTPLPSMQCVRSACGVGVVRGKAYVIGGCDDNGEVGTYEVFDLASNKWVEGPQPMPVGLCESAVAAYHDTIYIAGGCQNRFKSNEMATNEVHVFRPATREWAALPPLPAPRRLATAVAASLFSVGNVSSATSRHRAVDTSCREDENVALLLVAGGFDRGDGSMLQSVMSIRVRGMSYVPSADHRGGSVIWNKERTPPITSSAITGDGQGRSLVVIACQQEGQMSVQRVILDTWRARGGAGDAALLFWEKLQCLPLERDGSHTLLVVE